MDPCDDKEWGELMKPRGGLTGKQVEVMSILASQERTMHHIGFLLGSPTSTAARVVNVLTKKGLAYYDLVGVDGSYIIRLSSEGEKWVMEHGVPH